ncbi:MAG TPA: RNA polymerase factor sigma-54 [Phycisphaerae bacterium]|nr:RNA polymerase factor sigma-54 [Phycisphaerae bacterium]
MMRLDASQHLRLTQQMKLSPRIIQAMEILQLPMMALQERIEQEMQSNPVLDLQETGVDAEAPPQREDTVEDRGEHDLVIRDDNGHSEDFERLADFTEEYGTEFVTSDAPPRPRPPAPGQRDRKLDAMANAAARGESLNEYLLEQWRFVEVPDAIRQAGELIINYIEADGYLRTPLEEIAERANPAVAMEDLREALRWVQTMEPAGLGARDLKECLLLQLSVEAAAGRDVSLETEIVAHFLRDIEMNRLPQIARRTGRTVKAIQQGLENLSHLNPRPGSLIGQRTVPVVRPDAVVDLDEDGHVVVTMPDGNTPRLSISRNYRRMARNRGTDKDARQFIQRNVRSAEWLISAIAQRRGTVGRVVEEVFAVQREFLDAGPEALRPLPMADVANKVGVHVATVSRAVAAKYVQTPRGIFPLRMFFSGGTTTAGGQDMAWDAVKAKLKEVVDAEDKSNPLNDDQLAAAMNTHGIVIARRTVAKYRSLLEIPPARKRRRY